MYWSIYASSVFNFLLSCRAHAHSIYVVILTTIPTSSVPEVVIFTTQAGGENADRRGAPWL